MAAPALTENRLNAQQRRLLALLAFSVFINYIDRGNLSVAARQLSDELHMDQSQLGLLQSGFFWTYALMQFIAGWLVDRTNVRWTFGIAFVLWSAATAGTGMVHSFAILFLFRLLLGIGESVAYPSYSKIVAMNYTERHRGIANALIDAGSKLGPGLANLFGVWFVADFGWRPLFLLLGFGALIWVIPWAIWGPDDRNVTKTSRIASAPVAEILSKREAWGTFLGLFCGNYIWYFLLTWLPFYLEKYRGFSHGKLAILGALPFFAIAISTTLCGYLSDRLIAAGYTPTRVRKSFTSAGLLLSSIMFPAALAQNENTAIILLVVAATCYGMYSSNLWAVTQTLAGPPAAGKWTGLQNGIGNFSGIVCPFLTGVLADRTGSFIYGFVCVAVVAFLGAFCFGVVVRRVEPVQWSTGAVLEPAPLS